MMKKTYTFLRENKYWECEKKASNYGQWLTHNNEARIPVVIRNSIVDTHTGMGIATGASHLSPTAGCHRCDYGTGIASALVGARGMDREQ